MSRVVALGIAMSMAIGNASAADRSVANASRKFEQCMLHSQRLPLPVAVAIACCGEPHAIDLTSADVPRLSFVRQRLAAIGSEPLDASDCASGNKDGAAAALCALTSGEHHLLVHASTRVLRKGRYAFDDTRISVSGVGAYVRQAAHAARTGGYSQLVNKLLEIRQTPSAHDIIAELDSLLRQADFIATRLEARNVPVVLQPGRTGAMLALMSAAMNSQQPGASLRHVELGLSNSDELIVDAWASEASSRYLEVARRLLHDVAADQEAKQWTEQYISELMYHLTWRAGTCALACVPRAEHQRHPSNEGLQLPLPIRADLSVPISIIP